MDGNLLLRLADLLIGAGGTMSAEAALMGKPVISITPINFYVEKYLIKVGLIKKIRNSVTLTKYIKSILSEDALIKNKDNSLNNSKKLFNHSTVRETSLKIQSEMEDPIEIFKKFLFIP